MKVLNKAIVASMIDHTVLKAHATYEQILECCRQAKEFNFASVCVNPCHVKLVAEQLKGSNVKVCTVIGFPLGANTSTVKAFEANEAVMNGAHEIDTVINIGALKSGDFSFVENDIRMVVEASIGATVKVIIETCYLDDKEKVIACELAQKAGAHFVKTSTGFGTDGATEEDIKLMRKTVGDSVKIKASGGIRSTENALNMIKAGADRIGASSGIDILNGI